MERWTWSWRVAGRALQPVLQGASVLCSPFKLKRKAVVLAEEPGEIRSTSQERLDADLEALDGKKDDWQRVSCKQRAEMLEKCVASIREVAREAATAATQAHGSYGTGIGEEYSFWLAVALGLIEYRQAMEARGQPRPVQAYQRNGHHVADVFPKGMASALFGDTKFEVWIKQGEQPTQGRIYRTKENPSWRPSGRVSLVLGAGNHVSVVCLDVLHKLLCDDDVVIVKMNPQNEFLGVYVERALKPFFDDGFVRLVYGGAAVGAYLCQHKLVDNVHLTGSLQTFNSIVYGQKDPTEVSVPVLQKSVTAELGCVTPAIIVPGKWSAADLEYVAEGIVTGLASNSSHSCCALELLIVSEKWPQRSEFQSVLKKKLQEKECQVAWYSGSKARFENFHRRFPEALELGHNTHNDETALPWLLATDLSPEHANTTSENWCGVLQEVVLPSEKVNTAEFLQEAVAFCNERCWGTLCCTVIIHPSTQRDYSKAFQTALEDLKYGTIVVNAPPIFGFLPAASWGAFPGNPGWNVGSGNCSVHNTSLYDHPEKTVCYAPWRLQPVPIWGDISNKDGLVDAIMHFLQSPGILSLLHVDALGFFHKCIKSQMRGASFIASFMTSSAKPRRHAQATGNPFLPLGPLPPARLE